MKSYTYEFLIGFVIGFTAAGGFILVVLGAS